MTRAIRCIVAFGVAWSLQAGVSFAEADYLDRASGPGPFRGLFLHYRILCLSNRTEDPNYVKPPAGAPRTDDVRFKFIAPWDRTSSALSGVVDGIRKATHNNTSLENEASNVDTKEYACKSDRRVRGYVELTYRRAVSLENDLVDGSRVHLVSYEATYYDRFSRAFDFGVGVGINLFDPRRRGWDGKLDSGDGPDAFKSFRRISLTPSIKYAPFATAGEGKWGHLITLQMGATIFIRGFHARDFCDPLKLCNDPSWSTHGSDVVPMFRVLVDPSQLLP